MRYRDLVPGRLGGRLIASHIEIPAGGEVPDYVHFHDIEFQMIFCAAGWVRLVYEDQGEPFVLRAGDCVLQPPLIRHRVLEASAGLEVIEIGGPAEHLTRREHRLELPTTTVHDDRDFRGQRFVRHVEAATQVRRIWREVSLIERDARLDRGSEPDMGFSGVAFGWAAGRSLSSVLEGSDLTAGDFVRWVRQVTDFAGQIADAAGPGELRQTARALVSSMRRTAVSPRQLRYRTLIRSPIFSWVNGGIAGAIWPCMTAVSGTVSALGASSLPNCAFSH
jgi:quercetin dioxygenase-like cupin family protein